GGFSGRNREDELQDNLSLNPRKLREQRKGKSKPQTEELFKNFGDDVDWRSELNKRVAEIKKEKETDRNPKRTAKEEKKIQSNLIFDEAADDEEYIEDEDIVEEIIEEEYYEEDEKDVEEDDEFSDDEFDSARKNAMEIVESLKKRKRSEHADVYDDSHHEDYDEDTDEYVDEDEYDEDISGKDEESRNQRDKHYEPIPSDPDEIKEYIARKVAMRKGRGDNKAPSLAEEYGYKRSRKKQYDEPQSKYQKLSSKKMEPPPIDDMDSIYRPIEGKPQYKDAENILAEETRTLVNFKRLYAAVWDNLLLLLITLVIIKFGSSVLDVSMGQMISASWWRFAIFYIVLAIIYNVYFTTSNGQTIGKMMFHIRIISESGYQVSLGNIVLHCLLTIISLALATVGYLWFFFDFRGRNLADIIARTKIQIFQE
ncbi:MAG: RDD family protein, partial [Acidobacteria bacterium]|nr:RDD family protein [Acidobacteriota bacterium]